MALQVATQPRPEADTTRPEHHVVYLRSVDCGAVGCREPASSWMRCMTCKRIVARCGPHARNLDQQTQEHCRG